VQSNLLPDGTTLTVVKAELGPLDIRKHGGVAPHIADLKMMRLGKEVDLAHATDQKSLNAGIPMGGLVALIEACQQALHRPWSAHKFVAFWLLQCLKASGLDMERFLRTEPACVAFKPQLIPIKSLHPRLPIIA
jgi:hypothetical protein